MEICKTHQRRSRERERESQRRIGGQTQRDRQTDRDKQTDRDFSEYVKLGLLKLKWQIGLILGKKNYGKRQTNLYNRAPAYKLYIILKSEQLEKKKQ